MIGRRPAKAAPKTLSDLQTAVREANERGEALVIEGGKTLHAMGKPPARAAQTLSTTGLRKINAYESADLTISVEAGLTIRALRATLAEHAQFVPIDVPRAHEATVGGALASGWLGPRRHLFGRPRDYIIGSKIVLADGTLAAAGGMVVKNVAGYDMSRLYIGSFGTLGVLASANFKTVPQPPIARAFLARLPEGTRLRAMAHLAWGRRGGECARRTRRALLRRDAEMRHDGARAAQRRWRQEPRWRPRGGHGGGGGGVYRGERRGDKGARSTTRGRQ